MDKNLRNAALVASLLAAAVGCTRKPADDTDMHRLDDGKNPRFLAYAAKDKAGNEGNIEVGCVMRIMRVEVKEPGGQSYIGTAVNGFGVTRHEPTPASPPLTEKGVLDEMTRDVLQQKGQNKRSPFDFNDICDPQGNARDAETRAAIKAALIAPRGGNLVKNRRPPNAVARASLARYGR